MKNERRLQTMPTEDVNDITGDGRYATGMGVDSFTVDGMAYRYEIELNEYLELQNLPSAGGRGSGRGGHQLSIAANLPKPIVSKIGFAAPPLA